MLHAPALGNHGKNRRLLKDLLLRLVAPAVLSSLLIACSQRVQVQDRLRIEPSPPRIGPAIVHIDIPGAIGPVTVEADMAHPGMAPLFVTLEPAGAGGQYKGHLDLNMAGDWVILVKAKSEGGRTIERQFPITVSEK